MLYYVIFAQCLHFEIRTKHYDLIIQCLSIPPSQQWMTSCDLTAQAGMEARRTTPKSHNLLPNRIICIAVIGYFN